MTRRVITHTRARAHRPHTRGYWNLGHTIVAGSGAVFELLADATALGGHGSHARSVGPGSQTRGRARSCLVFGLVTFWVLAVAISRVLLYTAVWTRFGTTRPVLDIYDEFVILRWKRHARKRNPSDLSSIGRQPTRSIYALLQFGCYGRTP